MKKCAWCGRDRSKREFYAHPTTADRLQSRCKPCAKDTARETYAKKVGGTVRPYKRKEK